MELSEITQGSYEYDRRIGTMRIVSTRHEPDTVLERHAHDRACLTLVLRGEFTEEVRGSRFRLARGALLFKPAFEFHRDRYGTTGAHSMLLELPEEDRLRIPPSRIPHRTDRIGAPRAVRLATRIARRAVPGSTAALELESDLFELLLVAFGHSKELPYHGRAPRWVRRAYERLADAPADAPPLVELADEVGVHADHLIRSFSRWYGSTPGVFVRERRARLAAQRVVGRELPLAEIAFASGYADQSHMTREFRRFLGCTPGALRRAREAGPSISMS